MGPNEKIRDSYENKEDKTEHEMVEQADTIADEYEYCFFLSNLYLCAG